MNFSMPSKITGAKQTLSVAQRRAFAMVQLDWEYGISCCDVVEEVKVKQLSG